MIVRVAALALLLVGVTACPYVPEGEIRVAAGALPVAPGATVTLALYCDPLFGGWELAAGPGRCGRDWRVQGRAGGGGAHGAVDMCGAYTAPVARPAEPPRLEASECDWGDECTDACGAWLALALDGYPDP